MNSMKLDIKGILEFQQNRYPYLLVDMAEEVIPGVSAKGFKNLSINDWFFDCHFPGDPNMPGMLQIEAMVQLSALTILTLDGNKGEVAYLSSANNLKWSRKVVPGDRLDMETKLVSFKRGIARNTGVGSVNGELTCKADFTLILPHIMGQYKVNN
jgi:3-hydroxyacyl-[acyl-carrier-protein] dehydratase